MPPLLPHIPLQAKELLNFNLWSAVCAGGFFLIGLGLLLLCEKVFKISAKGIFRSLFLSIYCLICATAVYLNGIRQEQQDRLEWAQKIAFSRDLPAEEKFALSLQEVQQDGALPPALSRIDSLGGKDSIAKAWQNLVFSPSFNHYRCFFTFCEPEELLLLADSLTENCRAFFEQKAQSGTPTGIPGLYGTDYGIEYYTYLFQIPVFSGQDTLMMNVELGRKKFADVPGSMGLLLPPAYSYAFYSENELWSYNGSFLYPFRLKRETPDSLYFFKRQGYDHLLYPLEQDRLLVLSTPEADPTDILPNFSLFFILFGIAGALVLALFDKDFLGTAGTYARQLRSGMFMLLLAVVFVFGAVALFFIRQINLNENSKLLRSQSLSILAEMENRYMNLPGECLLPPRNDSIIDKLHAETEQLGNLFRKDIYLYSTQGELISSPRPESLLPERLDEDILNEIAEEQSHLLILPRQGSLLAFASFRNANGEVIGFFCLPYYIAVERQRAEMSRFLCTYLNIMVLLCLITFVFSSLLARRITKPLQLVTRMVAQIKPAQKNNHLEWKRKDEIGVLVKQYNLLVDELETSLRKLAESERENAWSEMARQVAHEIKNPLTPIKLQVQLLQRAYNEGDRHDFKERLDRFAELLGGQIDRLAHIAGAFSQFAQWQKPQLQEVYPAQIVRQTLELFKADEKITFRTEIPPQNEKIRIYADSGFLEQILINLIRNAVQALEDAQTPDPEIRLGIEASPEGFCTIYVTDNGPGIRAENREHIFEPRFTTRSTGAGLGLAICRRLAESMNAEIALSVVQPTTFTLRMKSVR
ncbi:MAG: HAMP domain-containing histidine kinase [Bacteroidales bacterium]|nr:HAMP domain-containing histidine kinase [Bacteroidales bacterium]